MRIIVDADACPVKDETAAVAKENCIEIIFVASVAHELEHYSLQGVKIYQVDNQAEAADVKIANLVRPLDIIISADYGLAAMIIARGGLVITPRGSLITHDNVDSMLHQRFISSKVRRGGGKTKGPKAFTGADRQKFYHTLQTLCSQVVQKKDFAD